MKRSQVTRILDDVRTMLANRVLPDRIEQHLRDQYAIEPLTKCDGEAHGNPHIDNCGMCSPRWGWLGDRIEVKWP